MEPTTESPVEDTNVPSAVEAPAPVVPTLPAYTAIIHIRKQSNHVSNRYGKFNRPDKCPHPDCQGLHLWLGRELKLEEVNDAFLEAQKSVRDPIFVKIITRLVEAPVSADLEALKKEHKAQMDEIQKGVNEFTAGVNKQIEAANAELDAKAARILELEAALAAKTAPADDATKPAGDSPGDEPAPDEAGTTSTEASDPSPSPTPTAAPKATKKKK